MVVGADTVVAYQGQILGKPADFDAAWDTILAKLDEIGVQDANAEMTKLTQEKIRFWGN